MRYFLFSKSLMGIVTVQTVKYFEAFPKDKLTNWLAVRTSPIHTCQLTPRIDPLLFCDV